MANPQILAKEALLLIIEEAFFLEPDLEIAFELLAERLFGF